MCWKKPCAMAVRSSWLSFWRPSMKKLTGKTDSPYAVERRGPWGHEGELGVVHHRVLDLG